MRILIADDEEISRLLLESALRKQGHDPVPAPDGRRAFELFQGEHFPVVVTDWQMPILDGGELCRLIRADTRSRYTYIIVLTVVGSRAGYREGIRAGADDFLVKPLDADQLESRLFVADRILRLQDDLRTLEGLLPICSYCKKIREGEDTWEPVETFVQKRTEAQFSHSICPACYTRHALPALEEARRKGPLIPPR